MRSLILICCLVFSVAPVHTQGWQRWFGAGGDQRLFSVEVAADGALTAAGSTAAAPGERSDWYWVRTDAQGHVLQELSWGKPDSAEAAVSVTATGAGFRVVGNSYFAYNGPLGSGDQSRITWQELDAQGNLIQEKWCPAAFSQANSVARAGNNMVVSGAEYVPVIDAYFPQPYFMGLDSAGAVVWESRLPVLQSGEAAAALPLSGGGYAAVGWEITATSSYDMILFRMGIDGSIAQSRTLAMPDYERPHCLLQPSTDTLLVIGEWRGNQGLADLLLLLFDPHTLDTLSSRRIQLPGSQVPHAARVLADGSVVIAGEHIPEGLISRDAFLCLIDAQGQLQWFKTFGGIKGDIIWDVQQDALSKGFVMAGQTASFGLNSDLQGWLLKSDASGTVWNSAVTGLVARDTLENCLVDPTEPVLGGWLMEARSATGTVYTLSDSSGKYDLPIDTGAWFVSVLPPSDYWTSCEADVEVYATPPSDTLNFDFPVQANYDCPQLDVQLGTPFLRRCFENDFRLRYFNYGPAAAPDAMVRVILDPYLSFTQSEVPFVLAGDTLWFPLGNVPSLQGGSFGFKALLDCDSTVLGQLHCSEAHIFPDSNCQQFNPIWDGSNLELDGFCAGDSVVITVSNTGFDMQSSVNIIITEDQIIFKLEALQLAQGEDTTLVLYPNGASLTIVLWQTPGHPGNDQPTLVVEGCGAAPFSTGYGFMFPQNDGDPAVDIECRQNVGSFDPNTKEGLPLGVGSAHVIAPETPLEYIIRFQNTGTDTAFRVEIRDTISPALDLATLRQGASSHPCRLEIDGPGVLHFIFDPIALPDSNVNATASIGFVQYRIHPRKGLAHGAEIRNRAGIYFDQNEPVLTNATLHTIGDPLIYLGTNSTQDTYTQNDSTKTTHERLVIFPTPSLNHVNIALPRLFPAEELRLRVMDGLGREYATFFGFQKQMEINVERWPAGVYFAEVRTAAGLQLACGSILKQ